MAAVRVGWRSRKESIRPVRSRMDWKACCSPLLFFPLCLSMLDGARLKSPASIISFFCRRSSDIFFITLFQKASRILFGTPVGPYTERTTSRV